MSNQIRKERSYGPLTVREVKASEFQKAGTLTAILEQVVTTKSFYPTKKFGNELNDNVFNTKDFGAEEKPYEHKETRIAFMLVPIGTTKELVEAKLKSFPKARIYRVLSSKPILTNDQEWAIKNGNLTLEAVMNRQQVINPSTGETILDGNNMPQYRATFLSTSGKEDQDFRSLVSVNEAVRSNVLANSESFDEE